MAAVSFGIGGQGLPMKLLNPLTGAVEKELEVKSAISSVYSRDGRKLLVNTMPILSLHPIDGSCRVDSAILLQCRYQLKLSSLHDSRGGRVLQYLKDCIDEGSGGARQRCSKNKRTTNDR
jgi:hypothetical protein